MRQRMADNNKPKGTLWKDLKESEQNEIVEQFKKLKYPLDKYRFMRSSNGQGWVITNAFDVPLFTARFQL
jgi:hypothetical protein